MPGEPLSYIDTAWLRMDRPSQPMAITVAMVFGPPLDYDGVRALFCDLVSRFRRFRQRAVDPAEATGRPYWQDDPEFNLDFHLQSSSLQPAGDQAALSDKVSQLMSSQLDFSRPPWQFHLIEEYGEGWALVGRVHHCLADGPALVRVLSCMTENRHPGAWPAAGDDGPRTSGGHSHAVGVFRAAAWASRATSQQAVKLLRNPGHLLGLARMCGGSAAALGNLLFRPQDPKTAFRGRLGPDKRVAWSEPIELEKVMAIGRLAGGTVNDVMLAASSGALRRYLRNRGEPVDGLRIRAGLSVNLRTREPGDSLGTEAGALLVPLPIGVADSLERLREVKRSMDSLKASPQSTIIYGLLNALGMAPADTQAALAEDYTTRETAMVSNVAGPRQTVFVAGAPLETLLFWVPAFGGVGLNLNIVSYADQIRMGVATDKGLVADPESIIAAFHLEFEALQALAGKLEDGGANGSGGENPIEAMNAVLDDALRVLDEMLEGE